MGIKMRMKLFICPLVGKMNWRCFSFLRMVTPSHIFGVPRKDPGHGAHRKVSVTLKPPYITAFSASQGIQTIWVGSSPTQ